MAAPISRRRVTVGVPANSGTRHCHAFSWCGRPSIVSPLLSSPSPPRSPPRLLFPTLLVTICAEGPAQPSCSPRGNPTLSFTLCVPAFQVHAPLIPFHILSTARGNRRKKRKKRKPVNLPLFLQHAELPFAGLLGPVVPGFVVHLCYCLPAAWRSCLLRGCRLHHVHWSRQQRFVQGRYPHGRQNLRVQHCTQGIFRCSCTHR